MFKELTEDLLDLTATEKGVGNALFAFNIVPEGGGGGGCSCSWVLCCCCRLP